MSIPTEHTALIVVDVQNDFCEGGALAVTGGAQVARDISDQLAREGYAYLAATRDYHIDPGAHFSDEPDFVRSWPPHCVAGTPGASFHPELGVAAISAVFSKGQYSDGYSGFEGHTDAGDDLAAWLRAREITSVDVVGIATEHCVRATSLDAVRAGFRTRVLLEHTAGISRQAVDNALAQLRAAGVQLAGTPKVAS